MDVKKILKSITLKDVLIVALVPSVLSAGYYGYKAFKKYQENKKEGIGDIESKDVVIEKTSEIEGDENKVKIDVVSEISEIGEVEKESGAKIIPITRGVSNEEEKEEIVENKIIKEA